MVLHPNNELGDLQKKKPSVQAVLHYRTRLTRQHSLPGFYLVRKGKKHMNGRDHEPYVQQPFFSAGLAVQIAP